MSLTFNIDQEWEKFITSGNKNNHDTSSDEENETNIILDDDNDELISANLSIDLNSEAPKSTNIYISTKTRISYLNTLIDLKKIFWNVPIISYTNPINGVVKKQMKFVTDDKDELEFIQSKLKNESYYEEYVITHIDNPNGRIKFKDVRKLSIGISKKDIMSYRCKKKSAFYNCFVLILRIKINNIFKEFHIKVFNTGKLEIPGIQNEETFLIILEQIIQVLQPHIDCKLGYNPNSNETVLINSNFNCGFYINREVLNDILKYKYNIQSIYDPCSYPGIQCKYYYNPDIDIQTGSQISEENKNLYQNISQVSFMIFRTGSVLIVGKCDENVLMIIYEFLKTMFNNEFKTICQKSSIEDKIMSNKNKVKKIRRKNITIEVSL